MYKSISPTPAFLAAILVFLPSTGHSQTPATNVPREIPDFTMQVTAGVIEDFNTRVWAYFALRQTAEKGLIVLTITDDPRAIERAEEALARRIREARSGAKRGDVFTPTIAQEFKKALIFEMDAATWASIMDDNPGEFRHEVNDTYQRGKSFSTVPPNVLALLPTLPEDVQYLFLGRHLILYDTRSHLIIDRIPYAIQCAGCDRRTRKDEKN